MTTSLLASWFAKTAYPKIGTPGALRIRGLEPITSAWKADNLPLIYIRHSVLYTFCGLPATRFLMSPKKQNTLPYQNYGAIGLLLSTHYPIKIMGAIGLLA